MADSKKRYDRSMSFPVRFSEKAIDEFIQIYEEEYGETIDRTTATAMAYRVLALYRLLRRKLPEGYVPREQPKPRDAGEVDASPIGFQT
jgi:hypothetical protein